MSYQIGPHGGKRVTLPDGRKAEILHPAGNWDNPDERNWYVVRVIGKKGTEVVHLPDLDRNKNSKEAQDD